jgi:predicted metal-dependent peptidase
MADQQFSNEERLSIAFMAAMASYPYFSVGLSGLVRRICNIPAYHTMAVTRDGVLLVDPVFLRECTAQQSGEVLVHELQHLLREHAMRSDCTPDVNREIWGIAADCEINQGLHLDRLPGDYCHPKKFNLPENLLAEEYYDRLVQQARQQAKAGGKGQGAGGGKKGQPAGQGGGQAQGKGVACGQCGSGSGGDPVDGEPEGAQGAAGRSEADLARIRTAVAAAVLDHVAQQGVGNVPAGLLRWAQQRLKPPVVRWQDRLRRAIRSSVAMAAGKVDYTRVRWSRRQSAMAGIAQALGDRAPILPALCAPRPRVAFGVDTSGSMGEAELVRAVSEGEGVIRALGVAVTFLACDCALADPPRQVRTVHELVRLLRGGGGTDFHPVMAAVERLRPRPDVFVFVTDGMGPVGDKPPTGVHVIWVLVGPHATPPCTWGEQIVVKEHKA